MRPTFPRSNPEIPCLRSGISKCMTKYWFHAVLGNLECLSELLIVAIIEELLLMLDTNLPMMNFLSVIMDKFTRRVHTNTESFNKICVLFLL